jgi:hypothetical protein
MGQFGIVELVIECNGDEIAENIADNLEEKVTEFIKTKEDRPFTFFIDDISGVGATIEVRITSNRYQNAEWQGEQILEYLKEKHKGEFYEVSGEITTPETYLYYNADEE